MFMAALREALSATTHQTPHCCPVVYQTDPGLLYMPQSLPES